MHDDFMNNSFVHKDVCSVYNITESNVRPSNALYF